MVALKQLHLCPWALRVRPNEWAGEAVPAPAADIAHS
jgi:hypothetical protein